MTSGIINVLAGDFKKGSHHKYANCFFMKNPDDFFKEKISDLSVDHLEIASNDNISNIKGAIGWGLAGSALLGPVGLLTGVMFGAKKNESITFICRFKDGRQFIGVTSSNTFLWIKQRIIISNFESNKGRLLKSDDNSSSGVGK